MRWCAGGLQKKHFEYRFMSARTGNYEITAYAQPVLGELDTSDNTYIDGMVTVFGQDTIPPDIESISRNPATPNYDENVAVSAVITESVAVGEASLSYTHDSTWQNFSISRIDDAFKSTIPAQPYGTTVQYKIYANDTNNN